MPVVEAVGTARSGMVSAEGTWARGCRSLPAGLKAERWGVPSFKSEQRRRCRGNFRRGSFHGVVGAEAPGEWVVHEQVVKEQGWCEAAS